LVAEQTRSVAPNLIDIQANFHGTFTGL